jgi:trans-aconitate 2-methyltransferase
VFRSNFAGDGNCRHFFQVVREAMSLDKFSLYFADFQWPWYMPSIGEYETLAAQSGLRGIRVWGENADRFFPDAEAMIKWVDQPSIVPFLARVAGKDKASFRDFVVRSMLEKTKQEDGRHFETFRRINVFARK